jgi:hypothetical protein
MMRGASGDECGNLLGQEYNRPAKAGVLKKPREATLTFNFWPKFYPLWSRNIPVAIMNNLTAWQRRHTDLISVGARFRNRLCGRKNLPFSRYLGELCSKIKRLDGDDDHLFLSSARDKNEWTFFTLDPSGWAQRKCIFFVCNRFRCRLIVKFSFLMCVLFQLIL